MSKSSTTAQAAGSTSRAGTIRFPIPESDVRAALRNASEVGWYPTWLAGLSGREVTALVDTAMASLQAEGTLDQAIVMAASQAYQSAASAQYREDAARVNPRYAHATYGPFNEVLPDGTEGIRWRFSWQTYGPSRWIDDDDVRALASREDQSRWEEIREAAVMRGKAARVSRAR